MRKKVEEEYLHDPLEMGAERPGKTTAGGLQRWGKTRGLD